MRAALMLIASMYGFALACLAWHRWVKRWGWLAAGNRFVGMSVGAFATGLLFILVVNVLFPQATQTTRMARMAADIHALSVRVDSLAARIP